MEEINDIIVMKVGPHSGMSLDEIIESKREEEKGNDVHYWGYSGVFCRPVATQEFCKKSVKNKHQPKLILLETKSAYQSTIGYIEEYTEDKIEYKKFKAPVQLQGAEFSFVAKNIRKLEHFRLDDYVVVGGKNDGKPLSEGLVFRVNKCFGTYKGKSNSKEMTAYIADLVEPYAVWLKEK